MSTDKEEKTELSWSDLLKSFRDEFRTSTINKDNVFRILSMYKSKEEDWSSYTFFDDTMYTRNLVDSGNGIYNLLIIAWNSGQGSCIHNHTNSSCFVKILAGGIKEIRYETPEEGKDVTKITELLHERDAVTYIDDSMGVHEMKNESANQAVTLHLYYPPYDYCKKYDRQTGESSICRFNFKSIYGNVVPNPVHTSESYGPPCC